MITRLRSLHFCKEVEWSFHASYTYNAVCLLSIWCLQLRDIVPLRYGFSVSHSIPHRKANYSTLCACTADGTYLGIKSLYLKIKDISYQNFQFYQIILNFMLIFKHIHSPSANYLLCKELIPCLKTKLLISVLNKTGLRVGLWRNPLLWLNHQ